MKVVKLSSTNMKKNWQHHLNLVWWLTLKFNSLSDEILVKGIITGYLCSLHSCRFSYLYWCFWIFLWWYCLGKKYFPYCYCWYFLNDDYFSFDDRFDWGEIGIFGEPASFFCFKKFGTLGDAFFTIFFSLLSRLRWFFSYFIFLGFFKGWGFTFSGSTIFITGSVGEISKKL